MPYHDELLSQALTLVHTAPSTQASLRRAVSSAYYAVFHLLIAEATSNWSTIRLRPMLGRAFDHGVMRSASDRLLNGKDFAFAGEDPQVVSSLRFVAGAFVQLQKDRHFADYNLTKDLQPTDAVNQVRNAEEIFNEWQTIHAEQIAQDYLLSLLVKPR